MWLKHSEYYMFNRLKVLANNIDKRNRPTLHTLESYQCLYKLKCK